MSRPLRVLSLYEGFFAGGARILHSDVVSGLQIGGDQDHEVLSLAAHARRDATVQPIARAIRHRRDATVQPMTDDPRYRRLRAEGVPITTLGRVAGDRPLDPGSFSDAELGIARAAIERADVVVSLKEQPLGLVLALHDRGMLPDVAVTACLHRSDPAHSGHALEWLLAAGERGLLSSVISCAQSTSDAYAEAGVWAPDRRVITNGIDTARFRPGDSRERARMRQDLGIPEGAPVVLLAARFDAMKDPGLFLRAVAQHARTRPDAHYVMCGAGMTPTNEAFRALVAATGASAVGSRLHPLGIRDDMPDLYRIADIVALTSAFGEAAPLCLIEGASCGATPVTTDVGDAAALVRGIGRVTPADARGIAATWSEVLAHRPRLRRLALAGRPRYDRARMIEEYRDALDRLVTERAVAA